MFRGVPTFSLSEVAGMSSNAITVQAVTPSIGAMVSGIDLSEPLSPPTLAALQQAWADHLVLFFRDQSLDRTQLQSLARSFGELHIHPQGDVPGFPGLLYIHTDKDSTHYSGRMWHSDVSCEERPPMGSILHLHEVPTTGGDTLFANMYAAYEALSAPMRGFLDKLTAHHSGQPNIEGYFGMSADQMPDKKFPQAVHPVVRTHPVTGRKALYVNEIFTLSIVELTPTESRALLGFLYQHLAAPRFQCRFQWRKNSVAMWDNRCAQHLALWDYYPQTRTGNRATIAGDKPY